MESLWLLPGTIELKSSRFRSGLSFNHGEYCWLNSTACICDVRVCVSDKEASPLFKYHVAGHVET